MVMVSMSTFICQISSQASNFWEHVKVPRLTRSVHESLDPPFSILQTQGLLVHAVHQLLYFFEQGASLARQSRMYGRGSHRKTLST